MHGLVASTFGVAVAVGEGVCDDVGGTDVLVEVGMGGLPGVLPGSEVPQPDEIKTRAIANLASQIFFIFGPLLEILIFAKMDLKNVLNERGFVQHVSMYLRDDCNPDINKYSFKLTNRNWISAYPIRKKVKEYQLEMKQR